MRYPMFLLRLTFILILLLAPAQPPVVSAQSGMASEVISAVNAFRANYGLAPYAVSGDLMSAAQSHSDYQASIQSVTHTRADGSGPAQLGFTENIAYSSTAQGAINAWNDYWHLYTMIGYETGLVGAGATAVNGIYYITLAVRNTGKITGLVENQAAAGANSVVAQTPAATNAEIIPVITSTPMEDGTIVHFVEPGQSMWAIAVAYNTTIAEIAGINSLNSENPIIFVGQKLIIRIGPTPTITGPPTETPIPPTRTPRPTMTPLPPTETRPPSQTPTLAPEAAPPKVSIFDRLNLRTAGIILTAVCGLGLLTVLVLSARKE